MTKIAFMGGAYKNAGDFLIEKRTLELLEANLKDPVITQYKRNLSFENRIEELNSYDLILFAGGPIYQPCIYPNAIPFVKDVSMLTAKLAILGGGWKGKNTLQKTVQDSSFFSKDMSGFLKGMNRDLHGGVPLGCRDWHTKRMLLAQGISKTVMTGCPAWYGLNHINQVLLNTERISAKPLICISDPANSKNLCYVQPLIEELKARYKACQIKYVYHRDRSEEARKLDEWIEKQDIEILDISGSAEGFTMYDSCDLHIGFRVHAHIYNLSVRNRSILLNEDARGAGVNHALGLEDINLYSTRTNRKLIEPFKKHEMKIFKITLSNMLDYMEDSNIIYENAFQRMKHYYTNMQKYICNLEI